MNGRKNNEEKEAEGKIDGLHEYLKREEKGRAVTFILYD